MTIFNEGTSIIGILVLWIYTGGKSDILVERLRIALSIFTVLHTWRGHVVYPIGSMKYRGNDNIMKLGIYFWIRDLSGDDGIDIF
jgi:hypothetical protein